VQNLAVVLVGLILSSQFLCLLAVLIAGCKSSGRFKARVTFGRGGFGVEIESQQLHTNGDPHREDP
jgi:hypothetical protein